MMADQAPDILIRPFDARRDLKEVQMLVGMSAMEQLAIANRIGPHRPLSLRSTLTLYWQHTSTRWQ